MTNEDSELTQFIKANSLRYEAPNRLRKRIDIALAAMDSPPSSTHVVEREFWNHWFQVGAAFAFCP